MRTVAILAVIGACTASTFAHAEDITDRMPRVMGDKMENALPATSGGNSLPRGNNVLSPRSIRLAQRLAQIQNMYCFCKTPSGGGCTVRVLARPGESGRSQCTNPTEICYYQC
jgi:hypothetical protein